MKKYLFVPFLIFLTASLAYAIPPGKNWKIGTAAELAAGTATTGRAWSAKDLADTFSGAAAEVVDATVGAAGDTDTTHAYSKDDIHDYVAQHDSDYDGLPDGVESNAIVDAMLNLTTPALGTPASVVLSNGTGLPISTGVSGLGTGIAAALAVNTGGAGAPVLFDGALGTPSSGTLTNATGLPIASGVSGLAANVATFLATPSLVNLNAAVSDATLLDDGAIADSTAIGLTNGSAYSNFGVVGDDSINELFAAIDSSWPAVSATAYDDIADPDASGSISFAGNTGTYVSTTDGWGGLIIHTNVANNASPTTLLTLQSDDANDSTNVIYLEINEDMDGTPVSLFQFKGRTLTLGSGASIEGIATITASTSVGTAAAEIPNIYMGDAAVLYGQADQSATLTSSASLWTANNFAVTTQFKLPSSDADPTATAGYLRHDSTVSNFTNGALAYYNGAAIKQLVDMTTATASACGDDQVVAYDADADLWYCKDDSTGSGSLGSNLSSTTNDILSSASTVILGATGGSNNEALTMDFESTANTVVISSTTGVTEIDLSSFKLVTDGVIHGAVNVKLHTAATYTNGTDDPDEVRGTYHVNSDDDTFALTLTAGSAGDCGCLSNGQGVTAIISVTPPAGDYLVLDGARGTAATALASAGAAGDKVCWLRIDATDIEVTSYHGTWAE